jgi:hypothetical protein
MSILFHVSFRFELFISLRKEVTNRYEAMITLIHDLQIMIHSPITNLVGYNNALPQVQLSGERIFIANNSQMIAQVLKHNFQ